MAGEGEEKTGTATENPSLDLLKKLEAGVSSLKSELEGLRGEVKAPKSPPQTVPPAERSSGSASNLAEEIQALSPEDFELVYDRYVSNEFNPETGQPWYDARLRRAIAKEHDRRVITQAQHGFGTTLREVTSRSAVSEQYPQLKDPKSEFSVNYHRHLAELQADPSYSGLPELEMTVAREIGARMGILPKLPGTEISLEDEEEEVSRGTFTRGGRPLPIRRVPEKPSVVSQADIDKAATKMGLRGEEHARITKLAKDIADTDLGIRAIKNTFGL